MFSLNRLPSGRLPRGQARLAGIVTVNVNGEFFPIGRVKLVPAVIDELKRAADGEV